MIERQDYLAELETAVSAVPCNSKNRQDDLETGLLRMSEQEEQNSSLNTEH